MGIAGRAGLWTLEQALKLLIYPFAVLLGFAWGIAPFVLHGLLWAFYRLTDAGITAHEQLHMVTADALGVSYEDKGYVDIRDHTIYAIQYSEATVPRAYFVQFAPVLLASFAVLGFSIMLTTSSLTLFVLSILPAFVGTRHSLPSDADARVVLLHIRDDPLNPFNVVALPVSLFFFILGVGRRFHRYFLLLSQVLWGLLLFWLSAWVSPLLLLLYSHVSATFPAL